jgi:hypothetical protein
MVIVMLIINLLPKRQRYSSFIIKKLKLPQIALQILAMSIFSGYPAGSKIVSQYYKMGAIDDVAAKKLCTLCSTSGMLFLLSTLGGKIFDSAKCGYILLISHFVSVMAVGFAVCLILPPCKNLLVPQINEHKNVLYESFYSATIAVIIAGGFICFFYTFAAIAYDLKLLYPIEWLLTPIFGQDIARAISVGLIEATGGCSYLKNVTSIFALPVAGFLATFGGVSILCQQLCYLLNCKIKVSYFVLIKFLQAVTCFIIALILSLLFL